MPLDVLDGTYLTRQDYLRIRQENHMTLALMAQGEFPMGPNDVSPHETDEENDPSEHSSSSCSNEDLCFRGLENHLPIAQADHKRRYERLSRIVAGTSKFHEWLGAYTATSGKMASMRALWDEGQVHLKPNVIGGPCA